MVQLLRCLVLAQITPKLHHKGAKRRFILSIAVFVDWYIFLSDTQLTLIPSFILICWFIFGAGKLAGLSLPT